jgi:hypothetical protein
MEGKRMLPNSRRRFLQNLAFFSGAAGLIVRRLAAEEPFDSLPATVSKNAETTPYSARRALAGLIRSARRADGRMAIVITRLREANAVA